MKEGQTGKEEDGNSQEETNYNKSLLSYFRQQAQDIYSSMASVAEDDAPVGDVDLGDDHFNTTHGQRSDANMNKVTTGAHRLGTPDIINAAKEKAKVPILWRFVGLKIPVVFSFFASSHEGHLHFPVLRTLPAGHSPYHWLYCYWMYT